MGHVGFPLQPLAGRVLHIILAAVAVEQVSIVKHLKVVGWTENMDVQNALRNRMDECFSDIVQGQCGIQLAREHIVIIVASAFSLVIAPRFARKFTGVGVAFRELDELMVSGLLSLVWTEQPFPYRRAFR